MRERLLLIDNDPEYCASLVPLLRLESYQVEVADSVGVAIEKLKTTPVDLALVDLRLSNHEIDDMSGLEVAKFATDRSIACIIITAYPSMETVRRALRQRGFSPPLAVDYVAKKDGPQALLDAIELTLMAKRHSLGVAPTDLEVDLEKRLVFLKGESVGLSQLQYALLAHLYRNKGAVCSYQDVIRTVYDERLTPMRASADRRLQHLVARLRERIEENAKEPEYLLTVSGRGLRLVDGS